jgi:hypothetical protein
VSSVVVVAVHWNDDVNDEMILGLLLIAGHVFFIVFFLNEK